MVTLFTFVLGCGCGFVVALLVAAALFLPTDVTSNMRRALRIRGRKADETTGLPESTLEEIRREDPALAEILSEPPAVEPSDVPAVVSTAQVNEGELPPVRNPRLGQLLSALRGWRPRSRAYGGEAGFGNSMVWHLTRRGGISRTEFDEKRKITLRIGSETRPAMPDYIFWDHVLVEIKGDVDHGSTSDRALGQMFRYMLAWKKRGVALLIICGYCSPVYKLVIQQYVDTWRIRFKMPVTVFFAYDGDAADVPVDVAAVDATLVDN